MNIAKKMAITALAGVVADRRLSIDCMGMRNGYGISAEERRQRTQEYELARAELMRAEAKLRKAQVDYANS